MPLGASDRMFSFFQWYCLLFAVCACNPLSLGCVKWRSELTSLADSAVIMRCLKVAKVAFVNTGRGAAPFLSGARGWGRTGRMTPLLVIRQCTDGGWTIMPFTSLDPSLRGQRSNTTPNKGVVSQEKGNGVAAHCMMTAN